VWIFTPEGFFSVVSGGEFHEELMIRARDPHDLDRLRRTHLPELGPNIELPGRDYPIRAFTTRVAFAKCLCALALDLDYSNFKSAVSSRHSATRAHIYGKVWQDCLDIEHQANKDDQAGLTASVGTSDRPAGRDGAAPLDRTAEYRVRDMATAGWKLSPNVRYGGVVFGTQGRILLREPTNHFDGYHWSFAKGSPEAYELPVDAALREVLEETGHRPWVVGHITEGFTGSSNTSSVNYYFVMLDVSETDVTDASFGSETKTLRWVDHDGARALISQTTNVGGRDRDLRTLEAAYGELRKLVGNGTVK
jgi:8-oxo-dGTP pyrophosphatase MutT (NUDIX family)